MGGRLHHASIILSSNAPDPMNQMFVMFNGSWKSCYRSGLDGNPSFENVLRDWSRELLVQTEVSKSSWTRAAGISQLKSNVIWGLTLEIKQ